METEAVIIGGGIAGLWCAWELNKLGLNTCIVERSSSLGGHAARLCCKATDACAQCGACRVNDVLGEIKKSDSIKVLTGSRITETRQVGVHFHLNVASNADGATSDTIVTSKSVVVAVGFSPFDAALKPRFGYGRIPGVVTALELENELRNNPDPLPASKIAFIQCVGSRDPKIGRNYCSRVCCAYALRLSNLIVNRAPETEISIFYMDLQSSRRNFEAYMETLPAQIKLMRAIPSQVVTGQSGKPELVYQSFEDTRVQEGFDRVVLSVGISPPEEPWINGLKLQPNVDGFLGPNHEGVKSGIPGIFVCGAAQGPKSIPDSVSHAMRAAAKVATYVQKR
jgi:heterodisulfide reductase subunit A2